MRVGEDAFPVGPSWDYPKVCYEEGRYLFDAEINRVGDYRCDPDGPREGEDADKTFSEVIRDRVIDEVGGRSGQQLQMSLVGALDNAMQGVAAIPADRVQCTSPSPA